MELIAPPVVPLPNRVPCGPLKTSTLATSYCSNPTAEVETAAPFT